MRDVDKELEHLKKLEDMANEKYDSKEVYEHSIPVQEALKRLESIDSVNPSEALENLRCLVNVSYDTDNIAEEQYEEYLKDYNTIKQTLERIEEKERIIQKYELLAKRGEKILQEDKPSEALECLEKVKSHFRVIDQEILMKEKKFEYIWLKPYDEYCDTIKQALIKSQEQEKVLKIMFEKNVDIKQLKHYIEIYSDDIALKTYNGFYDKNEELTQEEFELLKEMTK